MQLGAKLFEELNARQWVGNQKPVRYGQGGLSERQLFHIERQLGFSMPEDFKYLLQNVLDEGGVLFPWTNFRKSTYDKYIEMVLTGIEFDVEENGDWLERWGSRPKNRADRLDILRKDFPTWPKLLPVSGHRFLPAQPCKSGNPVFSIVQTDIVYYGANLADYLENEFLRDAGERLLSQQQYRHIEVWSDFVR